MQQEEEEEEDLCPICLAVEPTCFTECGHGFCVACIHQITKCALCRKELIRPKIGRELRKRLLPASETEVIGQEGPTILMDYVYMSEEELAIDNSMPHRYLIDMLQDAGIELTAEVSNSN